jgi:hypothetical protein
MNFIKSLKGNSGHAFQIMLATNRDYKFQIFDIKISALQNSLTKTTRDICQHWYDKIAALPAFLLHLEQLLLLPLESRYWKVQDDLCQHLSSSKEKEVFGKYLG